MLHCCIVLDPDFAFFQIIRVTLVNYRFVQRLLKRDFSAGGLDRSVTIFLLRMGYTIFIIVYII